ncbi:zinc finger CCCH domain-containing protein 2 [Phtheirospermum japonicum]|uniref:Zinc finger CCCH domain-containing protein 2 n=1 Tax=Phtheirospermum japonicum TaxID=374723 RepID=A0A830BFF0_9LAMI|nr:zinc finger CCCH domain-containing protein 2 [Phtheirospermum japonicum]
MTGWSAHSPIPARRLVVGTHAGTTTPAERARLPQVRVQEGRRLRVRAWSFRVLAPPNALSYAAL